jgi:PPOX class probable F420-dependent enzyme
MIHIDSKTEFGQRVSRRLEEEQIIWLTSVGTDGTPQPRPVWFIWDGETILIYSRPNTAKLRHIASNSRVALHFDGNRSGGDIVVFTGEAIITAGASPPDQNEPYLEKYAEGIKRINHTAATFARTYSVAIRITPNQLRGH